VPRGLIPLCRKWCGLQPRFSVTQSRVEVVQHPEQSKDDRPLWVTVEAFDLADLFGKFGYEAMMG
jgi:hypothetical protein